MEKLIALILVVIALLLFVPAICMWLWNWLMPDIFGLQIITYWQALGLMSLASCFFYRGNSSSK